MAPSTTSSNYFLVKMLALENLTVGDGACQVQVNGNPNGNTFSGANAPDAVTIWELTRAELWFAFALPTPHRARDTSRARLSPSVTRALFAFLPALFQAAVPEDIHGAAEVARGDEI